MTGISPPAQDGAEQQRRPAAPGSGDTFLFGLAVTTMVAIAVQFALAGFGAFTMDKTPSDNAYGAHSILGMVIALLTLAILVTVLAVRSARTQPRTMWLAVALVVLALPLQPILGSVGQTVPAVGALHALNGLVIFALTGWLTGETGRRRALARPQR